MASELEARTGGAGVEPAAAPYSSPPSSFDSNDAFLESLGLHHSGDQDANVGAPPPQAKSSRHLVASDAPSLRWNLGTDAASSLLGVDDCGWRPASSFQYPPPLRFGEDDAVADTDEGTSFELPHSNRAGKREERRGEWRRLRRKRSPTPPPEPPDLQLEDLLHFIDGDDGLDALLDDQASVRVSPEDARARLGESRAGLSKEAVCADGECIESFEKVKRLRRALEQIRDEIAPDNSLRLAHIQSLIDLCDTDQMDVAHYGTVEGEGDHIQLDHRCIRLKNKLLWEWARREGTISDDDCKNLSREGAAQTLNQKPLAMPVTVDGTPPSPETTYLGLCECVC